MRSSHSRDRIEDIAHGNQTLEQVGHVTGWQRAAVSCLERHRFLVDGALKLSRDSARESGRVEVDGRFCTTTPLLRRIMFAHIPATIWEARRGAVVAELDVGVLLTMREEKTRCLRQHDAKWMRIAHRLAGSV
jgi:hypothetical protein